MRAHANHAVATCPICHHEHPVSAMVPGELVRPGIAALVREAAPEWDGQQAVCHDCLGQYRSAYVEDVLEEERGELSGAEREVVESFRDHDLMAADINTEFEERLTFGQRIADRVASFGGSWAFIILFGAVLAAWIALNSVGLFRRPFDPFPFILLNLVLSCIAAVQAPVIMMSQNRQETKDRLRGENDYQVNLKAELEIRHLHEKLDLLLSRHWQRLLEIQRIQMDLMEEIRRER